MASLIGGEDDGDRDRAPGEVNDMGRNSEIRKVAFVGSELPRQCGIATFTHDLCTSRSGGFGPG